MYMPAAATLLTGMALYIFVWLSFFQEIDFLSFFKTNLLFRLCPTAASWVECVQFLHFSLSLHLKHTRTTASTCISTTHKSMEWHKETNFSPCKVQRERDTHTKYLYKNWIFLCLLLIFYFFTYKKKGTHQDDNDNKVSQKRSTLSQIKPQKIFEHSYHLISERFRILFSSHSFLLRIKELFILCT